MSDDARRIRIVNAGIVVVVLVAAAITAALLVRTLAAANAIVDDADHIAQLAGGINRHTDAVRRLQQTNAIARGILHSAQPLDGELARVVDLSESIDGTAGAIDSTAHGIAGSARSIDGHATRIDSTARTIDSTAGAIDATARGIHSLTGRVNANAAIIDARASGVNARAAGILRTSRLVDRDTLLINARLDDSIGLARTIFADTDAILGQAVQAHQNAACIDREVGGRDAADGHCDSLRGRAER